MGIRSLSDIFGERRNDVFPGNTIFKVIPKADPVFTAGLFQARKGITTSSPRVTSSAAADFPFLHILPDIAFTQVVMKREPRLFQDQ